MTTEQIIDKLGAGLAAEANIAKENKAMKAALVKRIEAGSRIDAELFAASHAQFERGTTAWKTIAERLEASRQMITANTKVKTIDTIKVVSR